MKQIYCEPNNFCDFFFDMEKELLKAFTEPKSYLKKCLKKLSFELRSLYFLLYEIIS